MLDHNKLMTLADTAGRRWALTQTLSASERSAARSVAFYAEYLANTVIMVPANGGDDHFHLACYLCSIIEPYAREGRECPFGLSTNGHRCDCLPLRAEK